MIDSVDQFSEPSWYRCTDPIDHSWSVSRLITRIQPTEDTKKTTLIIRPNDISHLAKDDECFFGRQIYFLGRRLTNDRSSSPNSDDTTKPVCWCRSERAADVLDEMSCDGRSLATGLWRCWPAHGPFERHCLGPSRAPSSQRLVRRRARDLFDEGGAASRCRRVCR